MNLRELQSSFARLVTDDAFRHRAQEDAAGANGNGELQSLARECGVEAHATTLKRKRLGAARSQLPLTSCVLGDEFRECFMEFSAAGAGSADRRQGRDALAFLAWLDEGSSKNAQAEAAEIERRKTAIRIDQAELRGRLRSRYLRVSLVDGRWLPESTGYPKARCLCIWMRVRRNGPLRRYRLRLPLGSRTPARAARCQ